jgi:outer membrane protein assembly factor BamB
MSRVIAFTPTPSEVGAADLVYREHSSRDGGLCVLMQDASPRAGAARAHFLRACFRHAVARYLDPRRPARAHVFLRECVSAFDAIARAVDTRLDDFEGLGVFVVVREPGCVHVLCARGAPARVRWRGVFVPLSVPGVGGVTELAIETPRAQHDLFTQTLPETLALYRVTASTEDGVRELLLGGTSQDMGAAIDLMDPSRAADSGGVSTDRIRHAVLMIELGSQGQSTRDDAEAAVRAHASRVRPARWLAAGVSALVVVAAGVGGMSLWRNAGGQRDRGGEMHTALKETPAPPPAQKRVVEAVVKETERAAAQTRKGFALAWQQSFRAPVTSSPAVAGDAVIFGGRDGRVYSVERESGERQWSYAAHGGVGASPVVRGAAVIAADYAGNVVRLRAGDGGVVWKRALREKIVSTPAVTDERVAVASVSGRVYALSLETGRVLWKFSTRGAIRGSLACAGGAFLVPSHDGRLYALAEETGARRWSVSLGGPVASSPASDGDIAVVGTARGDVVALDVTDGGERWRCRAGAEVNSALALVDGKVYVGAGDRRLYCIDVKRGDLLWRFDADGVVLSRPLVDHARVIVTSYDGAVYCLDAATGSLVDRYATGESIFSSPATAGGRVFFGNNAGRFFGLDSPGS